MLLTRCRECGREVGVRARTCPRCGVAAPAKWVPLQLAAYVVGVTFVSLGISGVGESPRREPVRPAVSAPPDALTRAPRARQPAIAPAPAPAVETTSPSTGPALPNTTGAETSADRGEPPAPTPQKQPPPKPASRTLYVTASLLNVRTHPQDGPVIDQLPRGEAVVVYGKRDDWALISHPHQRPRWVSMRYLSNHPPAR